MSSTRQALLLATSALLGLLVVRSITRKSKTLLPPDERKALPDKRKVYFAASIRGGREDIEKYQKIIEHLAKSTVVLTEHIGKASLESMGEAGTTDKQIYDRDMAWLRSADVVVAEVTQPSLGVGYEIAKAESAGTPVLCLFRPSSGRKLSAMLGGSPGCVCREYETVADAASIVDEFLAKL